jgi:hypothetical protein
MTLSPVNVSRQRENRCIVRQATPGNSNLLKGGFIIEITVKGDVCGSEVRLTTVGAKA